LVHRRTRASTVQAVPDGDPHFWIIVRPARGWRRHYHPFVETLGGGRARVAFVVQRYGEDILGGAESHARQIAQRLAQDRCWDVHVYTTTARSYLTWARHYPAGLERDGPVSVHRYDAL